MYHGTTNHGMQCVEPAERRIDTLTYFHKVGAIGQLFEAAEKRRMAHPLTWAFLEWARALLLHTPKGLGPYHV